MAFKILSVLIFYLDWRVFVRFYGNKVLVFEGTCIYF